jgi:hypothetical protein
VTNILILTIIYGIPSYVVFDKDNTTIPVPLQSLFDAFSYVHKSSFSNSFESELGISSDVRKYKFAKAMEKIDSILDEREGFSEEIENTINSINVWVSTISN